MVSMISSGSAEGFSTCTDGKQIQCLSACCLLSLSLCNLFLNFSSLNANHFLMLWNENRANKWHDQFQILYLRILCLKICWPFTSDNQNLFRSSLCPSECWTQAVPEISQECINRQPSPLNDSLHTNTWKPNSSVHKVVEVRRCSGNESRPAAIHTYWQPLDPGDYFHSTKGGSCVWIGIKSNCLEPSFFSFTFLHVFEKQASLALSFRYN